MIYWLPKNIPELKAMPIENRKQALKNYGKAIWWRFAVVFLIIFVILNQLVTVFVDRQLPELGSVMQALLIWLIEVPLLLLLLLPVYGLRPLSLHLVGQLIDLDADKKGGKHGVASRLGTLPTAVIYVLAKITIISLVILMALSFEGSSLLLLMALLPYLLIFPSAAIMIFKNHGNPEQLKKVAKMTVQIHLLFSLLLIVGFIIYL